MRNNMNPGYFAIIPATVRYDENLIPNAKLMYGEISALTNKEGFCFATNQYFSELYKVSEFTVSRWISQLRDQGHIEVWIDNSAGNKRKITIAEKRKTYCENDQDLLRKSARPIAEISNSNKRNNSINNKISKSEENTHFAFDFLKKEYPLMHESMIMKFQSKIQEWDVFIQQFNAVCEKEEINFSPRAITGRFTLYANNWIRVQERTLKAEPTKAFTPTYASNAF